MKLQTETIGSCLVGLLHGGELNTLEAIASCADAIAADARFNICVATVAKQQATEQHMVELVDFYERVTSECLLAVKTFRENGDSGELEHSMRRITQELRANTQPTA